MNSLRWCRLLLVSSALAGCTCGEMPQPSGECRTVPREDARFRVVRTGCILGYVVDLARAAPFEGKEWEPTDDDIRKFEEGLARSPLAMDDRFVRQYLGIDTGVLRVTFFCPDETWPYHLEAETFLDTFGCVRQLDFTIGDQVLTPHWVAPRHRLEKGKGGGG